jgi:hypothetical protein
MLACVVDNTMHFNLLSSTTCPPRRNQNHSGSGLLWLAADRRWAAIEEDGAARHRGRRPQAVWPVVEVRGRLCLRRLWERRRDGGPWPMTASLRASTCSRTPEALNRALPEKMVGMFSLQQNKFSWWRRHHRYHAKSIIHTSLSCMHVKPAASDARTTYLVRNIMQVETPHHASASSFLSTHPSFAAVYWRAQQLWS